MLNIKIKLAMLLFAIVSLTSTSAVQAAKPTYYYHLKIYHFKTQSQEATIDKYLKDAYLPALHRAGMNNIGVFKPIPLDTAERLLYVFIPLKRLTDVDKLNQIFINDREFLNAGSTYLAAEYNNTPYTRLETILLKAFSVMPTPIMPKLSSPKAERVYELRSYEAATEQLSLNKINMFNDHEAEIFTKLNFNAVFYGQVVAGSKMPNLMYLTTFNNRADRDQHWKDFGPLYKKISGLPQYQNNVSKNVTLFLYPTDYSDF